MHTATYAWDTTETAVAFDQEQVNRAFDEIVAPSYSSSGWVCSLTIECGTVVCACR